MAGAATTPEPTSERINEVVEVASEPVVDETDGSDGQATVPRVRKIHWDSGVETAQKAQARKFIERMSKKSKGN